MSQDDRKLPNDVEQLKAMIATHGVALAERDAAIVEQTAAIVDRDETIAQHETVIAAQHETIEQQLQKLDGLLQQLARVLRKQYGPQKERIDADQLTLFSLEEIELLATELNQGLEDSVFTDDGSADDTSDDNADENKSGKKRKRQGHGRRRLPDHLPRRQVIHELTDEERRCRCCGKLRQEIGSDVSEQLEFLPASLEVIEVACMAHCRRYWWESKETDSRRAHAAISYIARLYELEEQFRESKLTGDALCDARQRYAVPILDAFGSWLESERNRVLPQSPIGKAFTYTRNQWPALRRSC